MDRLPLTPRQSAILSWVSQFQQAQGFPPTIREIGAAFGIKSPNGVATQLRALARKGWIEGHKRRARTIRPLHASLDIRADMEWMLT